MHISFTTANIENNFTFQKFTRSFNKHLLTANEPGTGNTAINKLYKNPDQIPALNGAHSLVRAED